MLRFARAAKPCPGCDEMKILAFYDTDGRPSCATCTANPAVYACPACGREGSPFGRHCGPCALSEGATALLSDSTGAVHPHLQPVFDALLAARRPQSLLYWFTRSPGPAVLGAMARGEIGISHAALDELPASKAKDFLRHFLVAVGVLPAYHARLERVAPWLADILAALPPPQADIVGRFAKWQVLRRLRDQAHQEVLTPSSVENGRAAIVTTVRFLGWLDHRGATVATATQAELDR